jgi:membrane-bound ClpP family serine protease
MIVFGICLLIIAAIVPKLAVLWGIGIIVLVVGVILAVLGSMGRAVGGDPDSSACADRGDVKR